MAHSQPIIIVEDDEEDQEILKDVFKELEEQRELLFFQDGFTALDYLRNTTAQPFLILTDINMPGMDGVRLREAMCKDEYLKKKSIPFVFLTTTDGKAIIDRVYELQVQGFFQKATTFSAIKEQIKQILDYWGACKHPNAYR